MTKSAEPHRGAHVHAENIGKHRQSSHTLLDTGATTIVNADNRAAVLQSELRTFTIFSPFTCERTTVDGEILRIHGNKATIHGAVTGD